MLLRIKADTPGSSPRNKRHSLNYSIMIFFFLLGSGQRTEKAVSGGWKHEVHMELLDLIILF